MRAIPIDVLRAFIAVVDSRGFTRAAEDLGRSQPTVSLQVKRLEELIETPLFEKSSRLTLSRAGEICLQYGRRLLAQHDEMMELVARERDGGDLIRLGMPSEFAPFLVPSLAAFSQRDGQSVNFDFTCEISETLLERLRAQSTRRRRGDDRGRRGADAVARWRMPMSWISAPGYRVPSHGPVQLITPPEGSLYYQIAAAALSRRAASSRSSARARISTCCAAPSTPAMACRAFADRPRAQERAARAVDAARPPARRHARSVRQRERRLRLRPPAGRAHDRPAAAPRPAWRRPEPLSAAERARVRRPTRRRRSPPCCAITAQT